MIDYIIYGEFDINEGNVVKVEWPNKIGINETVLASYLIPEGTHNFKTDSFCFILNRKLDYEKMILNSINNTIEKVNLNQTRYLDLGNNTQIVSEKVFQLKKLYNFNLFNNQWESLNINDSSVKENNLFLKIRIDKDMSFFNILIYNDLSDEIFFTMYKLF
jgi:hypothetical protein